MQAQALALSGVMKLTPRLHGDARGFFCESYNAKDFRTATGSDVHFVQDNHSRSVRGVLRGLHYQLPPHAQGKLVRVIVGEIFDVVVDIRRATPTFGHWLGEVLSAENRHQLWIPPGFAHGFLVLSESAEIIYKTTAFYSPAAERAIAWNDAQLNISWPLNRLAGAAVQLSDKDRHASLFAQADVFKD